MPTVLQSLIDDLKVVQSKVDADTRVMVEVDGHAVLLCGMQTATFVDPDGGEHQVILLVGEGWQNYRPEMGEIKHGMH